MKAIVYTSGTGFTKRYAEMTGEKFSIPVYTAEEAKKALAKGEEIIYFGWVFANEIVGLKKAAKRFKVCAACAVGLFPPSAALKELVAAKNKLSCPLFLLRGGLDYSKLRGLKRKLIQLVREDVARENRPEDAEVLEVLTNGGDFVSEDNLAELAAFILANI